eukprot:3147437-Amphidinium_carterae.1
MMYPHVCRMNKTANKTGSEIASVTLQMSYHSSTLAVLNFMAVQGERCQTTSSKIEANAPTRSCPSDLGVSKGANHGET